MDYVLILGFLAGSLTTLSFIPQAIKTWRSHSAKDLSLFMFLLFSIGVFLWCMYGILIHQWPVILFNAITLVLALFILAIKIKNG